MITISQSTLSTSSTPISSPAESRRVEREGGRETLEQAPEALSTTAFAALLQTTQNFVSSLRSGISSNVTPERMFETASPNARQHRADVLRADDRQALDAKDAGRFDRSSIDARRNSPVDPSGDRSTSRLKQAISQDIFTKSQGATHQGADPKLLLSESLKASTSGPRDATEASPFQKGFDASSMKMNVDSATLLERASATVSTISAGAVSNRGSGPTTTSVAEQLGKVLGATRTGEVESARSTTQAPAAAPSNQTSRRGTGNPSNSTSGQTGSTSSGPSSQETSQTENTNRSTFDQLIRTMRLQTGMNRSSAKMMLQLPALGKMHLDVQFEGEKLNIVVRTQQDSARELIMQRAEQLTSALQEQGIRVQRFDVITDATLDDSTPDTLDQDAHDEPLNDHQAKDFAERALGNENSLRSARRAAQPEGAQRGTLEDENILNHDSSIAAVESRLDILI